MPSASKFVGRGTMDAEPPAVYLQPAHNGQPPMLFVGNVRVVVESKARAGQWAKVFLDWAISGS